MSQVLIDYEPSRKQKLFHTATEFEVLYGGAAGGGKTIALVMDAFAFAMCFPGVNCFFFRRTFRELEDTIIKEARIWIPEEVGQYNTTSHETRLRNGSVLKYRQCETEEVAVSYRSTEFNWLGIDELTTFTESMYLNLRSRVRMPEKYGVDPYARYGTNPGGLGHAWVKRRFVSPHPIGGRHRDFENPKRWARYLPATVYDNPHVNQGYIENLKSLPAALRDAFMNGSWDAFEGQCFVEFTDNPKGYADRRKTHVITPFIIPKSWPRFRSMDWGFSKPFSVGWWAAEPGTSRLYRYAEWYGTSGRVNEGIMWTPAQIVREMRRREQEHSPDCDFISIADPHIWDNDRGESVGDEFVKNGIAWIPGDNQRLAGKLQLHVRLRFNEEGYPGLYVFNTCKHFIRTIPTLIYDKTNPEDVDTDGEDHIYDDTRYMLQHNPVVDDLPVLPDKWTPPPIDPFRNAKKRGRS